LPLFRSPVGRWERWLFAGRKALAPMDQAEPARRKHQRSGLDRRPPVAHPDDELGRLTKTINAMIAGLSGRFRRSPIHGRRIT